MLTEPPSNVEETPTPAVSSLRSRFERLAVETSATQSTPKLPSSSSHALLAPNEPGSPRPRSMSDTDEQRPSPRSLRPAVSSSDIKVGQRRPPPPPPARPSRTNSPASLTPSPLLAPVANVSPSPVMPLVNLEPEASSSMAALLSRRPPPPPDVPIPSGSTVSSLIHKLGISPAPTPLPPRPRIASNPASTLSPSSSNVSLPHINSSASDRAPRHSFPLSVPTQNNNPQIYLYKSSDYVERDSPESSTVVIAPQVSPPPLPSRRHGVTRVQGTSSSHARNDSSDSAMSSSSDFGADLDRPTLGSSAPVRPSAHPPPRPPPPPRNRVNVPVRPLSTSTTLSVSPGSLGAGPPPLPARKSTVQVPAPGDDLHAKRAPPPRHRSMFEPDNYSAPTATQSSPSVYSHSPTDAALSPISPPSATGSLPLPPERKPFGSHLPPPTRTIAPGERLPPTRRSAPEGSSSEEEDEDPKVKIELLPDSSRSSRKPPIIDCHKFSETHIHVPAYTSVVVTAGNVVAVAAHHRIKIYDLSKSNAPLFDLDAKAIGVERGSKDCKITSMEFRPSGKTTERGAFLWIGTKDGHLFELDVRVGAIVGMKLALHTNAVTHILKHGRSVVTIDDGGKALIFNPEPNTDEDVWLSSTQPRVVRIADKQDFVRIFDGKLWTSAREPNNLASTTSRGPIIRIYDIFTPGATGKSLLPTEHLGTVTSGAMMQSQKNIVFIGHEGGYVSIWSLNTEDGMPICQEAVKVSISDVLSLEGVNDRLWAGGRKGMISAYDVVPRPWVMTNSWMAHSKLPVLRITVDPTSIEKLGRLAVYSVGRDEHLRFWDGLLGVDWVEQELLKRETEFSQFRDLNVLIVSWNLDSAKPDALHGTPDNINFLQEALKSVDSPDIIAFGFQELIDLESRKMAAKTVLLGGKGKNTDGSLSQRVTTSYKKWYDKLVLAVRLAMPPDTPYTVIHTENLVGLFSCIFVKDTQRISLKQVAINTIKRGMGGRYGNKGGIIARFVIDDSSICFINCHLAAGQSHVRQRNADIAAFFDDKELFPESDAVEEPLAYVNGGDGSMVLDHEIVFLNGDMNYRIDLRREAVIADIKSCNYAHLLTQDQLLKEIKTNRGFRLRSFVEGPLNFPPTYKYDRRSSEYDSSDKRRVPAWCDRVLWRSREPNRVQQLHYRRYEVNVSDHRPISAGFLMTVKSIDHEARTQVKHQIRALWSEEEKCMLAAVQQFFQEQAII